MSVVEADGEQMEWASRNGRNVEEGKDERREKLASQA